MPRRRRFSRASKDKTSERLTTLGDKTSQLPNIKIFSFGNEPVAPGYIVQNESS
jgi:hypothetical protein